VGRYKEMGKERSQLGERNGRVDQAGVRGRHV
jgi:hypothetical protein